MKKKYILSLVVISIMFLFVLGIGTGYGLWVATKESKEKSSITLNCFKVYFSSGDTIEMRNVDSVVNEEGVESSPYTLTVTNICSETKELQVRLNVLKDSTIDTNSLTIIAAGNIEKEMTLYKNLSNTKSSLEDVEQSKLIGLATVEPNETIRTNIKMWFDEKKAPNIDKTAIFKARFELIDTESSVKPQFSENILNNIGVIESKGAPNVNNASFEEEGLYMIATPNGKSYYYRGVVNNNYVKFANLRWRIIGVNENNSVRLILDKSAFYQKFSDKVNAPDYTGLKYVYNNELINNTISNSLNDWYNTNILAKDLDKYVAPSNFCNDSSYNIIGYSTYFSGYQRIINEKNPSLTCPSSGADFGGSYNQKVGQITADEIVLAGGAYGINNFNYYLYNGENFYTQTPYDYSNYTATLFTVNNSGSLVQSRADSELGVRPVISLIPTITVSGSGTQNDPYTIDEN